MTYLSTPVLFRPPTPWWMTLPSQTPSQQWRKLLPTQQLHSRWGLHWLNFSVKCLITKFHNAVPLKIPKVRRRTLYRSKYTVWYCGTAMSNPHSHLSLLPGGFKFGITASRRTQDRNLWNDLSDASSHGVCATWLNGNETDVNELQFGPNLLSLCLLFGGTVGTSKRKKK